MELQRLEVKIKTDEDVPVTIGTNEGYVQMADDDEEEVGTLGALENVNTIGTIGGLKNLENVQQLFGKSDPTSLQLLVNPEAAYKHNYIMMDSRYRKTDTFGIQEQSWNFLSNSTINATGAVNSLGSVKNIVAMTVPELRLPFKDSIILNGYKRVSLLIKEFSGQSHVAQETRKFHFMLKTVVDGNNIDLIPLKYGNQEELSKVDFGKAPFCLILPAKLNFMEKEIIAKY